ncbi:MAG: hypothetical protein KU29_12325 [Sulfurovum sp. FS06-10]|nr:MAG: hypothetical protein KU29_12325 [Sulfurovum sp. FS06-10]
MIWIGQYKAIMGIVFIIAVILGFTVSSNLGVWLVLIQLIVSILLAIVNFLMKAIKGKPLFYNTKVL